MPASQPAPEIPDVDITTFVLADAGDHADKPALIDGPSGRAITYAQLDAMTGALAGALAARGLSKGDAVCIYMPNLPEYAVVFHGVSRAGGVNTTANPLYTARELEHQLNDSGARMIFTVPAFLETARTRRASPRSPSCSARGSRRPRWRSMLRPTSRCFPIPAARRACRRE
jgi:acyl-CoA synthetase (AMP-forming)/AMP-acid ligase II